MKQRNLYRFIVLLFAVGMAQASFAQNDIFLGVKGGISIPNLTSGSNANPVSSGWSSREGPYFGAVGEFYVSKSFSIQVELNYSSQGGKKDGEQALPNPEGSEPPYLYANINDVSKINYLELPVLAKMYFPLSSKLRFFVDLGPYAGFLLSAKQVTSGSSKFYADQAETEPATPVENFDNTQDIKSDIKGFNFGVQGGVGLNLNAGPGDLIFSAGGNYGFIPIQKNGTDGQNNTGAATITLGYVFKIK